MYFGEELEAEQQACIASKSCKETQSVSVSPYNFLFYYQQRQGSRKERKLIEVATTRSVQVRIKIYTFYYYWSVAYDKKSLE